MTMMICAMKGAMLKSRVSVRLSTAPPPLMSLLMSDPVLWVVWKL